METNIQLLDRVGEIVVSYPSTAEVFKQFRIDFCCGGSKSLLEVIQHTNIDQAMLLEQLREAAEAPRRQALNWNDLSSKQLIDYIVRVHHGYLKTVLPHVSGYVKKITYVHGPHHPELVQVSKLFETLRADMEQHMEKEEAEDFPAVLAYEQEPSEAKRKPLLEFLNELEREHEGSGDLLKQIREVTRDYKLPEDACTTFQLTYAKLQELEADMFQHIHLENNILFKRAI